MGEPVDGLGHTRFEYDPGGGTDPLGNPIPTQKQVDETNGWGFALAPMQIVDAIRKRSSADATSIAERLDVSFGYQHKRTTLTLVPGTVAEADNLDWGVLARIGILPGDAAGRSTRVEVSAGHADLNSDENSHFVFPGYGDAGPSVHIRRNGVALRAVFPFGGLGDTDARPWAWPKSVPSAVGLGVAFDVATREYGTNVSDEIRNWGFEATFMDILAARVGYVDDPTNDIHSMTGGVGVHAPVGPWATLGYDWANHPSAPGMKNMNRHGWSLWLHPDAIWRSRQGTK